MQREERLVRTELRGDVMLVLMADSARRNALSVALVSELIEVIRWSRGAGARALVIASAEKAFCAGADIRDMLDSGWLDPRSGVDTGVAADVESRAAADVSATVTPPDLFEVIERDERPILAAVDGMALGGGVELCLACDLLIAGDSASFMFPELALGVLPNTALARLPNLIGARAAADLILTRRRIDAAEAFRLKLVNEVVAGPGAVERALAVAADIVARVPPTALAAAKRILHAGPDWGAIRSMLGEMDPDEWKEGVTAFLDKRSPDYQRFWEGRIDAGAQADKVRASASHQ
ncbi:MAG: enoyl-CoA hydratase/isomerase family protein [Pseudomonadota bacterium]